MKKITIYLKRQLLLRLLPVLSLLFLMTQCEIQPDFEYDTHETSGVLHMTAWEFIQTLDTLSLMEQAVTRADMSSYYSGTETRTFILPNNQAFKTYMSDNSYAEIDSIPVDTLTNVLKYHIVKSRVIFSDPTLIKDNPIAYETESGEIMYLSRNGNYQGLINEGTAKTWTIITSNLEPTNGVIHVTKDVVYLSQ